MRSFALSVFASLAFGLFCSAAPTPAGVSTDVLARSVEVPAEDTKCLESILTGLVVEMTPIKEQIYQLNTVTATSDVCLHLLGEVKEILTCAVADVKALVEVDIKIALKSVTTGLLLDVKAVALLLSGVLHVVFLLLECLLGIVTATVKEGILPLVIEIVCLVADLLTAVLCLVASLLTGVIAALGPLIADIVHIIIHLNVKAILDILCL